MSVTQEGSPFLPPRISAEAAEQSTDSRRGRRVFGVTSIVLSLLAGAAAHLTWGHSGGLFPVLPFYIIVPFTIIGLATFITVRSTAYLAGAAVGCLLVVAPPFAILVDNTLNGWPGGADIGLGLLLMALPILIGLAGFIGGFVGSLIGRLWKR